MYASKTQKIVIVSIILNGILTFDRIQYSFPYYQVWNAMKIDCEHFNSVSRADNDSQKWFLSFWRFKYFPRKYIEYRKYVKNPVLLLQLKIIRKLLFSLRWKNVLAEQFLTSVSFLGFTRNYMQHMICCSTCSTRWNILSRKF